MTADGRYTAVVDRREGDRWVLLLERDGETVDDLVVPGSELPAPARRADVILSVRIEDGDLAAASVRPEETRDRAEDARSRFDRLARRPGDPEEPTDDAEPPADDTEGESAEDRDGDATGGATEDAGDDPR